MPGGQELLVIAVIALLVFGPERLPELARDAGKLLARLRSETQRNVGELKRVGEIQQLQAELKDLRRDLHGAREDVRQGVKDLTSFDTDDKKPSERGAAATDTSTRRRDSAPPKPLRADDDPPPFDPEAT
ncbi:MAG: twin-arginine translocase TatA/TatE family subunit [Nitriliruptoraceae bacterium]